MGFTENAFLFVFLPLSVIAYITADKLLGRDTVSNSFLVAFSLVFYYWAGKETLVVFLLIVVFTFVSGTVIESSKKEERKKKTVFPVIALVGVLVFYKSAERIVAILNDIKPESPVISLNLIIPLGLSFVIFEAISYILDIYHGNAAAGNLLECLMFLALFPKLISGPIVLWRDFNRQLEGRRVETSKAAKGIDKIIIGYAKKVIIADSLGFQVALIDAAITAGPIDTPTMWLKALLYFFQLYYDFSGYSDIAIGLCNVYGFDIKENFDFPYLSKSVSEFWRRWHISLGSWFREYVYIPMGGNRKGNVYAHLMIVFLLTGIWHGAGLNFLIWGGLNGLFVSIERFIRDKNWYKRTPVILKWALTIILIYFMWIVFSAPSLKDAFNYISGMFTPVNADVINFTWQYYLSNRIKILLSIAVLGQVVGFRTVRDGLNEILKTKTGEIIKRAGLLMLLIIDIMFVVNSTYSPFMYFQF